MAPSSANCCSHGELVYTTSRYAAEVGFQRPTSKQRAAAATTSTSKSVAEDARLHLTFPGPLILPEDDLALDPAYPPQSLRSWLRDKDRNALTPERKTVYVAAPPLMLPEDGAAFLEEWSQLATSQELDVPVPQVDTVLRYVRAFYHGLPVKLLSGSPLRFVAWEDSAPRRPVARAKSKNKAPDIAHIGLATSDTVVRIRVRRAPPSEDGSPAPYSHQLHLDDLLDAAIDMLPPDAHALLLFVRHDLFEAPDDVFCCGRAYGGSRVAVVSAARYDPRLDAAAGLDTAHAWPAAHCAEFVEARCREADGGPRKKARTAVAAVSGALAAEPGSALRAAVDAVVPAPARPTPDDLSALWLARVCLTASHELGHCFGIDHCVYYACAMQGSASLREDARQPPYLCPVDLAKLARAVADAGGNVKAFDARTWALQRERALLETCETLGHSDELAGGGVRVFKPFAAWLRTRIAQLEAAV